MLAKKNTEWKEKKQEKNSFRAKSARLAASRLFVQQSQNFLTVGFQFAYSHTVDA